MSIVSNVILSFSILEDVPARLTDINAWLADQGHGAFRIPSDPDDWCAYAGGEKAMERPTFLGAFNLLNAELFALAIANVRWVEPREVQLLVCGDGENRYSAVYDPGAF